MPVAAAAALAKRPIDARRFVGRALAFALALAPPSSPLAAETGPAASMALTEAQALARALARKGLADATEGAVAAARGEASAAGLWPNPELSWSRERVSGGPGESTEHLVWLNQEIDLSGRRGLHRQAAEHRVGRVALEAELLRREVEAAVGARFYETLAGQQRTEVATRWAERLALLAATVARRAEMGDASGYDRRRLERESGAARSRRALEQAALARAREGLRALIAGDAGSPDAALFVTGSLLPETVSPTLDELLAAVELGPAVGLWSAEAEAARAREQAAGREWAPGLKLSAGYKDVQLPDDSLSGPMVGISLAVPLWDHGQARARQAGGERQLAEGWRTMAMDRIRGEVRGLWLEASTLAAAAAELGGEPAARAAELARIAEAAYEGGELGVLELVDAHRSAAEAEFQRLDLEAAARRARIELRRVSGGGR